MYGASWLPTMYFVVSPRMPTSLGPYEWFSSTITATGGGVAARAETGSDVTTAKQTRTRRVDGPADAAARDRDRRVRSARTAGGAGRPGAVHIGGCAGDRRCRRHRLQEPARQQCPPLSVRRRLEPDRRTRLRCLPRAR